MECNRLFKGDMILFLDFLLHSNYLEDPVTGSSHLLILLAFFLKKEKMNSQLSLRSS